MSSIVKLILVLFSALFTAFGHLYAADDEGITWLVNYDGKALPDSTWTAVGKPNAKIKDGGLRILDDSNEAGHYRAAWKADTDDEIIVEAKVRQIVMAPGPKEKRKPEPSWFTARGGSPVAILVSDGRHQGGLVLFPTLAMSFTDRFITMSTTDRVHTYRLAIRGTDMSMWVDGVQKVMGQNAFWKPAASPEPFIQFGSNAKAATGDALWASVKLGVRKPSAPIKPNPLKVTISEPWNIPREEVKQTRPYLAAGPDGRDATEMTAVIRGVDSTQMTQVFSHDGGRTWDKPIMLEEGRVAPDLFLMGNGVLACSYGRPASCIMFSIDGGKTWCSHHVVSDKVHFNYCSIREISPGRLLFVHDAPKMNAVYIDVERVR